MDVAGPSAVVFMEMAENGVGPGLHVPDFLPPGQVPQRRPRSVNMLGPVRWVAFRGPSGRSHLPRGWDPHGHATRGPGLGGDVHGARCLGRVFPEPLGPPLALCQLPGPRCPGGCARGCAWPRGSGQGPGFGVGSLVGQRVLTEHQARDGPCAAVGRSCPQGLLSEPSRGAREGGSGRHGVTSPRRRPVWPRRCWASRLFAAALG